MFLYDETVDDYIFPVSFQIKNKDDSQKIIGVILILAMGTNMIIKIIESRILFSINMRKLN